MTDSEENVVSEQDSEPIYLMDEEDPDDILKQIFVEVRLQHLNEQVPPVSFKDAVQKVLDGDWGRYRSVSRELLPREVTAEVTVSLERQGGSDRYEVIYFPAYGPMAEVGTRLALN